MKNSSGRIDEEFPNGIHIAIPRDSWAYKVAQNVIRDRSGSIGFVKLIKGDERVALAADMQKGKMYYCLARKHGSFPVGTIIGEDPRGIDLEWQDALKWATARDPMAAN